MIDGVLEAFAVGDARTAQAVTGPAHGEHA
jgi:hypothetical protein